MALTIVYGHDEPLARWACERVPWADYNPDIRAVGVADGDELLAVVTFFGYAKPKEIAWEKFPQYDHFGHHPGVWYNTVECGIYARSPRWASRRIIKEILSIPFRQFKVRKVRLVVPSTNKRALRFAEGIGFTPEGTLRHEYAKGVHACVLGLLRNEFERADFLARKKPARKRSSRPHEHRQGWRGISSPAN